MEYVQEQVTTLHDLTGRIPDAPTDRTAVVVPMTDREFESRTAERVLSALETVSPNRVVVPLRAPHDAVGPMYDWLSAFDVPLSVLWCSSPRVEALLDDHGLTGPAGKGRDVWLALGVAAADSEFVVCHDADTKTYDSSVVPRLLAPLDRGFSFTKGYYARVEENRFYGRLFRLFYAPLVRTLRRADDGRILDYLAAFRYALAGEFGMTADLAAGMRVERDWGLEVGTLGGAFEHAGFDGSAQVDLGRYEHDHRGVAGPGGLSTMSEGVGSALFRVCEAHGVTPEYETLPERYRDTARRFVRQYAADAEFNGLDYDSAAEREQVETYADAVRPPDDHDRHAVLPAWDDTDIDRGEVLEAARPILSERRH
ncbi:glycosyl transferase family 2 [Haladaptatus sp. T7]|uniref:glycosyl transferase family 2 n=1 Tax=Haladaptatus sp. T7 TaxID=2029368 RepID=UPI0021A25A23|nr:glycosyl transferase family 2 [Haladaptatus sp. T7]GKZ15641.1 glycosyl transferase family 2 [Haladaptatus sp. T7]